MYGELTQAFVQHDELEHLLRERLGAGDIALHEGIHGFASQLARSQAFAAAPQTVEAAQAPRAASAPAAG